jgi:hypothetical protein
MGSITEGQRMYTEWIAAKGACSAVFDSLPKLRCNSALEFSMVVVGPRDSNPDMLIQSQLCKFSIIKRS